jgi:hypothetical protein
VTRSLAAAGAVILLGLLLASCGGDDGPTVPPPVSPPLPAVAELPPLPVFGSLAPVAQAAEDTVSALLASIDTPAVMNTALAPVSSLGWTADGTCWTGHSVSADFDYEACPMALGWSWSVRTVPDFLLADGETDASGRGGDFRAYAAPGVVAVTWTWTATASRDSVEWTYARENESALDLHWSRDQEGARLWRWTWPEGQAKQVGYRVSAARTTGWCETYDRSSGSWRIRQEIAWDGGHGHWLTFDDAGQETSRETW